VIDVDEVDTEQLCRPLILDLPVLAGVLGRQDPTRTYHPALLRVTNWTAARGETSCATFAAELSERQAEVPDSPTMGSEA
jgi:hypothetical protein